MFSIHTLPCGLRIVTAPVEGTASVTVLVFAGAGSRYETNGERGIGHFLEHMFFKGGDRYPTTKDVSAAIDGVGGEFNAFTGKEYAGYYVKVDSAQTELACDVLSDMLLRARFPADEIDRERGVIIEEERMYQDTPMYRAGWDFEELLLGNHPLGWDTIGTEEFIRSVQQKDFLQHKDELYTPDNLVLTIAGNITEKDAIALGEKYFGTLKGKKSREFLPLKELGKNRVFLRTKTTEQAHLVLGVPAVSALDKDHFAHKLLAVILGGTMSSRMFLSIREARGLCYYISTESDSYLDAGMLATRAGVDPSRLEEAITAVRDEYAKCAADGITDEELTRAKSYFKGRMTLGLEDSEERAHFYGKQLLLYPKVRDIPDYFTAIDGVTKKQIDALAKRILTPEAQRLVVISSEKSEEKFHRLIGA
jgi:predicted Zn-dependent peptidase